MERRVSKLKQTEHGSQNGGTCSVALNRTGDLMTRTYWVLQVHSAASSDQSGRGLAVPHHGAAVESRLTPGALKQKPPLF